MSASKSGTHWLVAVPNASETIRKAMRRFDSVCHVKGKRLADVAYFSIPELKVGTLDQLMVVSDDLVRTDAHVEGVVRKAERLFYESAVSDAGGAAGDLTVGADSVHDYVKHFEWDTAQFDNRDNLHELVKRMQNTVDKADQDIRQYAAAYAERKAVVTSMQRKKGGNLMVGNLDDVFTPELVGPDLFVSTEFLQTVVVVINKPSEEKWLEIYESLDGDSVPFGPPDDRDLEHGSPVVPNTATRITEDKEGFVLYTVVVLRRYIDSFREACREHRFNVREYDYNPDRVGDEAEAMAKEAAKATAALTHLRSQCRRKYSEVFTVWIHIKAIRVFAECVLRFGLPVNFVCALAVPTAGSEDKLHASLQAAYAEAGDGFDDFGGSADDLGATAVGLGMGMEDFYPYVFLPFTPERR